MENNILILLLKIGGIAQIAMALGSLFLPGILRWRQGLSTMPVLLRQMFWVYAGYIFGTNVWLGIVTLVCTSELLRSSSIAIAFVLYAAVYWLVRVGLQFFYFNKSNVPRKTILKLGELALNCNFIFLAIIYSWTVVEQLFL